MSCHNLVYSYQDKQRELNEEKAEDLVVLKQQQELLKRLIAQQKQVCFLKRDTVIYALLMIHPEEVEGRGTNMT